MIVMIKEIGNTSPAGIYLFKVNNGSTRTKVTITRPERRQ